VRCSETIANVVMETPAVKFVPKIHSGSHSEIEVRHSMDDDHIASYIDSYIVNYIVT